MTICRNRSTRGNCWRVCGRCCGERNLLHLPPAARQEIVDLAKTPTTGEFDLLSILVAHPNKVLDRDRILDLLTGAERSPFDRSIDVRVTRLRAKIEPDAANPVYIRTIWGKGYMFCPAGNG